ncbi:MAG TPA: CdaR family protein [Vicinamibacterales bacterium]|jgi:YbbR domain-containing protein|nr:CdaR family protein [Vicinamibacterales bacterium]
MMRGIWPFRHFGLKVLSFGLALMLWMVVSGEETVERGLRVPLELQQFPPGLELHDDAPSTVDVRVRGASGALSRVSLGDIVAVLDLRGARAGRRLFHLTPEQVRAPFGVEVIQVTPPTVAMVFEPGASRLVPVTPDIEGDPAPGYVIGKITSDPATVEMVGPASAVGRVSEAITEPISLDGASAPVRENVTVGFLDPAVRLKLPRSANVLVDVLPGPEERVIGQRPVHLRNVTAGLSAEAVPPVVDVRLRGSGAALSRIEADDVSAYVDLARLGAGQYTLTVHAGGVRDAGVTGTDPAVVQVRISRVRN